MATKDFRASQIETSKIIGTGSVSGTTAGIVMYSGSIASDREGGTSDSAMFSNVGSDVFLFVSGTINTDNVGTLGTKSNVALFGGDVVVSGTLYAERQVIEVDSSVPGNFFVTGNMFVEPDSNSTKSVAFRTAAGNDIFIVDSTNKRIGVNVSDPDAQVEIFGTSTPHLKLSNNVDDFATFAVGTHGDLTITTVDAAAGAANFVIDADGAVDIDADAGALSLDGSAGINIGTEADVAIDIDASTLDIDASGVLTIDSATSISIGAAADKPIDIDSTTLDIDASGAITIDGTSTFSVDAVGTSNITTHGTLTLSGSDGLAINSDTGPIVATTRQGNIELTATAGDIHLSTVSALHITGDVFAKATIFDVKTTGGVKFTLDSDASSNNSFDIQDSTGAELFLSHETNGTRVNFGRGNSNNFMVSGDNDYTSIFVDAGEDAVALGWDGDAVPHWSELTETGTDVKILLSGTVGSRGGSTRGTTLVAGDLAISGSVTSLSTLTVAGDLLVELGTNGQFVVADGAGPTNYLMITGSDLGGILSSSVHNKNVSIHTNNAKESFSIVGTGEAVFNDPGPLGADTVFTVSGSIGSRGTATKGTSVFGGDTVISGGLYVNDTIYSANDTDTRIVFSDDQIDFFAGNERLLKLDETADDEVVIGDGGDVNFRVATKGYGYNLYVKSEHNAGAENAISIRHASPQEVLHVSGAIRIDSEGRPNVLFVSGTLGTNSHQVLILSGGSGASTDEAAAEDVAFYVSGSIGSSGTAVRGASVFGGDLVVSGNTKFHDEVIIEANKKVFFDGVGPASGNGPFIFGNTVALSLDGDNRLLFYYDTDAVFSDGNDKASLLLNNSQVLIMSGGGATSKNEASYADLAFFVSGSVGSRGTAIKGTSVFGGDVHISGSITSEGTTFGGSLDLGYDTSDTAGLLPGSGLGAIITVDNQPVQIKVAGSSKTALAITGSVLIGSGANGGLPVFPGNDINFFVSGSVGSRNSSTAAASLFGGDLVISGALTKVDSVDGSICFDVANEGILLPAGKVAQFNHTNSRVTSDAANNLYVSGALELRLFGDDAIVLNSLDNGIVKFKKGNTEFLRIAASSPGNDVIIQPKVADKDIIFKENATGGGDEVFRIDSTAKNVLFAAGHKVTFGAATRYIGDGTSYNSTANDLVVQGSNNVILAPGSDSQAFVALGTNGQFVIADGAGPTNYLMVTGSGLGGILSSSVHNKNVSIHTNNAKESFSIVGTGEAVFNDPGPLGGDTVFTVSGSIGSKGTATKGTAVFGGDLVVSGALFAGKQMFKQRLGWPASIGSADPRFPAFNGEGANTNPDVELYWSVLGSGSFKALDLWVSDASTSRVNIGFFANHDVTPLCHVSGAFVNEDAIGDGNRGHFYVDLVKHAAYVTGSNSFNPGDIISVGIAKGGGSTFTKVMGTLYYEVDTMSLENNRLAGTPS